MDQVWNALSNGWPLKRQILTSQTNKPRTLCQAAGSRALFMLNSKGKSPKFRSTFQSCKLRILQRCPNTHQSTAKRRRDLPARVSIHNLLDGHIHPGHTNERSCRQCRYAQPRHWPPVPHCLHTPLIDPRVIQPECSGKPVREVTGEKTGCNANQIVEDWHTHRQHECCSIHQKDQEYPYAPTKYGIGYANFRISMAHSKQDIELQHNSQKRKDPLAPKMVTGR